MGSSRFGRRGAEPPASGSVFQPPSHASLNPNPSPGCVPFGLPPSGILANCKRVFRTTVPFVHPFRQLFKLVLPRLFPGAHIWSQVSRLSLCNVAARTSSDDSRYRALVGLRWLHRAMALSNGPHGTKPRPVLAVSEMNRREGRRILTSWR